MEREWAVSAGGIAVFAAFAAFGACSSESTNPSVADSAPLETSAEEASTDSSVSGDVYEDLSFDFATDVAWDVPTLGPDAPAPPVLACSESEVEPESGSPCPLPPSECVGTWVQSYLNGSCIDGLCKWFRVYHDCAEEGGSECVMGHCRPAIVK